MDAFDIGVIDSMEKSAAPAFVAKGMQRLGGALSGRSTGALGTWGHKVQQKGQQMAQRGEVISREAKRMAAEKQQLKKALPDMSPENQQLVRKHRAAAETKHKAGVQAVKTPGSADPSAAYEAGAKGVGQKAGVERVSHAQHEARLARKVEKEKAKKPMGLGKKIMIGGGIAGGGAILAGGAGQQPQQQFGAGY